jgi:serine protease AprX
MRVQRGAVVGGLGGVNGLLAAYRGIIHLDFGLKSGSSRVILKHHPPMNRFALLILLASFAVSGPLCAQPSLPANHTYLSSLPKQGPAGVKSAPVDRAGHGLQTPSAEHTTPQIPQRYWVLFCDKGPDAESRLAQARLSPRSVLSAERGWTERALERRSRQNLRPDLLDLPVHPSYVQALEALPGVRIKGQSRWVNGVSLSVSNSESLAHIAALPFVSEVRPVMRYRVGEEEPLEPTPPAALRNRPLPREALDVMPVPIYGQAAFQVEMLRTDFLHRRFKTGGGMLIGVFDGGFIGTDTLPQFKRLIRDNNGIADVWNFHLDNDSVYRSSSHGTAVLSAMAGVLPGQYSGTAPDARYALYLTEVVEFERIIEEDYWVFAAERADMLGVDLINTSLGYTTFDSEDAAFNHTYADMDGKTTIISRGANWAASRGMLVVVSAGNQGASPWRYISAPADADSALAVGAVDAQGQVVWFSSRGPSFDGRVKPNVAAVGAGTALVSTGGNVVFGNGTSFSAPLICGSAACLWQAFPERSNMEIFRAIERSASHFLQPNDSIGYGIPDFSAAWQLLASPQAVDAPDELNLFPNPVLGSEATVVLGSSWSGAPASLSVTDPSGRLLRHWDLDLGGAELHRFSLDGLASWPAGLYLLRAVQGERTAHVKFFLTGR